MDDLSQCNCVPNPRCPVHGDPEIVKHGTPPKPTEFIESVIAGWRQLDDPPAPSWLKRRRHRADEPR